LAPALVRAPAPARQNGEFKTAAAIVEQHNELARYQIALENVSHGVCFFDAQSRLVLCNRRYLEIYRLEEAEPPIGATLREIVERRAAVGTCPTSVDDYLANSPHRDPAKNPRFRTVELKDGRTIRIYHHPMPDGGWVSTHEDISALQATQRTAAERISLQALIDCVPDYLWVKDLESRFVVANRAVAADCGCATPSDLIGLSDFDVHAEKKAEDFRKAELRILKTGEPMIDREESIIDPSGAEKWFLSTKIPMRNDTGEVSGLVGIARDITSRKLADALRDGQTEILEMIATGARLASVLDRVVRLIETQYSGLVGAVFLLDPDRNRFLSGAAPNLAPSLAAALEGLPIGPEAGPCGVAAQQMRPVFVADLTDDPTWAQCREIVERHGLRSCWATPIQANKGAVLGVLAIFSKSPRSPTSDEMRLVSLATRISGIAIERKQAEDRITFMANHDVLTGLPNRALLEDRISQAIRYAERYDRWASILLVDLDDFKLVNDSLGHHAGDALLKIAAKRILRCVRETDTVVRLGGDEFALLLFDQPKSPETLAATAQKIGAAIAEPVHLDGTTVRITSSIGIASYPNDGEQQKVLLSNADAAMYRAKEAGGGGFKFYTPEMNMRIQEKLLLQEELRSAILSREFVLHYQPQVDLRTGKVLATEALIRWNHPTKGLLSPDKFIPLAEDTGLIVAVGDWVLNEACRQNKAWQEAGLKPMTVCVNVSARQFREKNLVESVENALRASGLKAQYLELELTESLVMQDVQQALATMKLLQKLGVQLSIDDFGTGYSSLSALKTFPVVRLKIDKSFIRELPHDEHDKAVTTAVISLGQKLNMRVIAEGVETEAQVTFLKENNCDEVQGYRFCRPSPAAKIEQLLRSPDALQGLQ